jgi:uncharacterized protein
MIARFSTRYLLAAFVAVSAIGVVTPSFAQPASTSAQTKPPSATAILLAKQIIVLKGVDKIFDPLVRGVIEKVKDQFMQTNFMYAKDLNEIAAQLEKQYAPRASELVDASARIYASHFTEAELRQILAFYQSPVGRKVVADEPKILDESLAHAGEWGTKLSGEIIDKMRAEMKKRGHDI